MRRVLTAALVAAATMMLGAAPAAAGGPTSVLLTNPGEARAAALYYADPRYAELEELLHADGATSAGGAQEPVPGGGTSLNLTWLIHDVSVWRTDTVLLDSAGGAWISTSTSLDEAPVATSGDWSRLAEADRIRQLAASLDLVGAGGSTGSPADGAVAAAPETVPQAEQSAAPPPEVTQETRWFSLSGWRWVLPGLLIGLAVATLVARTRRTGPAVPRQELVDRPAERVTTPG